MKRKTAQNVFSIAVSTACAATTGAQAAPDRTILPIQEPTYPYSTELDVRNATPPPRFEVKAPEDALNVLIVLVDDLGFAGMMFCVQNFVIDTVLSCQQGG